MILDANPLIVTHEPNVARSCECTPVCRPCLCKHVLRWTLTVAGIVPGVTVLVAMHSANDSTVERIAGAAVLMGDARR
jgi:hypothetical protein